MTTRSILMGCCAALALALPAQAQTVVTDPVATTTEVVVTQPPPSGTVTTTDTATVTTTTTTVEPPANAGAFDALSPGQQKIARSLFESQRVVVTVTPEGTATAPAGWTLDDIAAARQGTGWGNVVKQMQADGVIQAKNLGQVVSGKAAPQPATVAVSTGETATTTTYRHTRQTPVVVSYGNGSTTMVSTKGGHARSPIVTADGGAAAGTSIKGGKAHTTGSGHAASVATTATSAAGATALPAGGKANGQGGGKGHTK